MHHPQGRVRMLVHWRMAANRRAGHHVGVHSLKFGSCCGRRQRKVCCSDHCGDCWRCLGRRGWAENLRQAKVSTTAAALHGLHEMAAIIMHVN